MKAWRYFDTTILLALALLGAGARQAQAQPYELSWWTADGGGAMGATGSAFVVSGTCGQPDAGGALAGAPYASTGGFWALFYDGAAAFQADLACTKTDGQATAIPGLPVTYTIVVRNAGPHTANGAAVLDTLPAPLTGATWTCAASPGSSCTPSGAGGISDTVVLPSSGTVTYTLDAVVDPAATGVLANTASVTPPAGVTDPVLADNTATDTNALTPHADLAISKSDSADPVLSRDSLTYTLQVTNLGPSVSPSMTLLDPLPGALGFVSVSPGSPACAFSAPDVSCALGPLAPLASAQVTIETLVTPQPVPGILNSVTVTGGAIDPNVSNNAASEGTSVAFRAAGELGHGTRVRGDLGGLATLADEDYYRIEQQPYSSYEVVVDETSGDIGAGAGPALERLAPDGTTVVQTAQAVGAGSSRSLRFVNTTGAAVDDEMIRVQSQACGSDCGSDDVYRLRAYDTTYLAPRFNNASSQVTVLLLQNSGASAVAGRVYFWSAGGALLHEHPFTLAPQGALSLNTASIAPLAGQGGSATVAHDGPHGSLAGKAVALEPSTGFSFDTPLAPRPR